MTCKNILQFWQPRTYELNMKGAVLEGAVWLNHSNEVLAEEIGRVKKFILGFY